jgi:hypothetical protein
MKYYRTSKGSHRHATYYCANARRAIGSGDPIVIPASEVKDWAACEHCCSAEEVKASAEAQAAKPVKVMCPNRGVDNPRRLYSTCRDCGKEGKVNGSTGSLRAHTPKS